MVIKMTKNGIKPVFVVNFSDYFNKHWLIYTIFRIQISTNLFILLKNNNSLF